MHISARGTPDSGIGINGGRQQSKNWWTRIEVGAGREQQNSKMNIRKGEHGGAPEIGGDEPGVGHQEQNDRQVKQPAVVVSGSVSA